MGDCKDRAVDGESCAFAGEIFLREVRGGAWGKFQANLDAPKGLLGEGVDAIRK
jgi:hypothetical protein